MRHPPAMQDKGQLAAFSFLHWFILRCSWSRILSERYGSPVMADAWRLQIHSLIHPAVYLANDLGRVLTVLSIVAYSGIMCTRQHGSASHSP